MKIEGLYKLNSSYKWAAFTLLTSYLLLFGIRKFDFHPDESIYLSLSRLSTWNSSGLVFTDLYSWTLSTKNPGMYARLVSAVCGLIATIFALQLLKKRDSPEVKSLGFVTRILPFCLLVPFWITMLRVRPEASILAIFTILLFLITRKKTISKGLLVTLFGALLVCNHSISLVVTLLLCLYLTVCRRARAFLPYLLVGTLIGLYLNGPLRYFMINGNWNSLFNFQVFGAENSLIPNSVGVGRSSTTQILNLMFRAGPFYISDQGGIPSIWKLLFGDFFLEGGELQNSLNHLVISSVAPIIYLLWTTFKGIKVFFIGTAPYLVFLIFGYFNPTYSSFIFLISFLLSYTMSKEVEVNSHKRTKIASTILIVFALVMALNSISFVATRLIPYGSASYFKIEPYVYDQIKKNVDSNLIISERYGAILSATGKARSYDEIVSKTIYKSGFIGISDYSKVNMVIVDSTDFLMYGKPLESLFPGQMNSVDSLLKRLQECKSHKYEVVVSRTAQVRRFNSYNNQIVKSMFMGMGDIRSTRYMRLDCERNRE